MTEGDDNFFWCWSESGQFSSKSTYNALLGGRETMPSLGLVWKSKAPTKCKILMWLVRRLRCWSADRLERHGMDHPEACPFCEQEPETINHLLLGCSFARDVWVNIFDTWNKVQWTPTVDLGWLNGGLIYRSQAMTGRSSPLPLT